MAADPPSLRALLVDDDPAMALLLRHAGDLRAAASQDYIAGLRMIDLGAAATLDLPARGRALLLIPDENLARLTALLVRHSGVSIQRVTSLQELENGANRIGVSLVVLSVVGTSSPEEALGGLALDPGRPWGLVALVTGGPTWAAAAGADHVVHLPLDPATFAEDSLAAALRGGD